MNFNLLLETYLSNYRYEIPQDKELLLYDFYVMEFLDKGPGVKESLGRSEEDQKVVEVVMKETKEKLLSHLKKEMLGVVSEAIKAELDNFPDAIADIEPNIAKVKKLHNEVRKSVKALAQYAAFNNQKSIIIEALYVFDHFPWQRGYGGQAWARICEAWIKLSECPDSERYIWIDHVYDLQHNTDTVFEKITEYAKKQGVNEGFKWIRRALDYKANIKTPWQLIPKSSVPMQRLASYILKEKGYGDFESGSKTPEVQQAIQEKILTAIDDISEAEKFFKKEKNINVDLRICLEGKDELGWVMMANKYLSKLSSLSLTTLLFVISDNLLNEVELDENKQLHRLVDKLLDNPKVNVEFEDGIILFLLFNRFEAKHSIKLLKRWKGDLPKNKKGEFIDLLSKAASFSSKEMIDVLIEKGAKLSDHNFTALRTALAYGKGDIAEYLIKVQPSPEALNIFKNF